MRDDDDGGNSPPHREMLCDLLVLNRLLWGVLNICSALNALRWQTVLVGKRILKQVAICSETSFTFE